MHRHFDFQFLDRSGAQLFFRENPPESPDIFFLQDDRRVPYCEPYYRLDPHTVNKLIPQRGDYITNGSGTQYGVAGTSFKEGKDAKGRVSGIYGTVHLYEKGKRRGRIPLMMATITWRRSLSSSYNEKFFWPKTEMA